VQDGVQAHVTPAVNIKQWNGRLIMTSLAFHVTIDCGMCCGGKDITGGNAGALRQPVTELHVYRAGPGVAAVQLKADGCFLPVFGSAVPRSLC